MLNPHPGPLQAPWALRTFSPLVEEDHEDDVVPEHTQAMKDRHLDHKGKQVVDDGVEELVGHLPPRQVGHGIVSELATLLDRLSAAEIKRNL